MPTPSSPRDSESAVAGGITAGSSGPAGEVADAPTPGTAETVVEFVDVVRRYRKGNAAVCAIDGASLRLSAGERVALVGPSGCGKSTLLNLASAVDRADGGSANVCGWDLRTAGEEDLTRLRRRAIGVVFQAFHLMPNLTAAENVALPLALDGRRDPKRVQSLLNRVGLGSRAAHYPSELSGGEEQRVAIARALVHRPRLLVADEPTGNLDSNTGLAILDLFDELHREERFALLIATHDPRVAERADRVVSLSDGRIVHIATQTQPSGSSHSDRDG